MGWGRVGVGGWGGWGGRGRGGHTTGTSSRNIFDPTVQKVFLKVGPSLYRWAGNNYDENDDDDCDEVNYELSFPVASDPIIFRASTIESSCVEQIIRG